MVTKKAKTLKLISPRKTPDPAHLPKPTSPPVDIGTFLSGCHRIARYFRRAFWAVSCDGAGGGQSDHSVSWWKFREDQCIHDACQVVATLLFEMTSNPREVGRLAYRVAMLGEQPPKERFKMNGRLPNTPRELAEELEPQVQASRRLSWSNCCELFIIFAARELMQWAKANDVEDIQGVPIPVLTNHLQCLWHRFNELEEHRRRCVFIQAAIIAFEMAPIWGIEARWPVQFSEQADLAEEVLIHLIVNGPARGIGGKEDDHDWRPEPPRQDMWFSY